MEQRMIHLIIKNPILLELIERGFEFKVTADGIVIDGFYKSGIITLKPEEDGTFMAYSRYNQTDKIDSYEDLISLNYYWWQFSKTRSDGWKNPTKEWGAEMVRIGLVKIEVEEVIKYI